MSACVCKRFLVSGRVQGVFFRASTAQQAERLGISGYAKNLLDGRVEVLASGTERQVALLAEWLVSGPPLANVTAIESEVMAGVNLEPDAGFATR